MELTLQNKRTFFNAGLAVLLLILLGRFAYVQIYLGEQFLKESEKNRVRPVAIEPPRGLLRDRYKEVLVDNRPAYAVYVVPAQFARNKPGYQILATAFHTGEEDLRKQITRTKRGNLIPTKIERQIDFSGFSLLHERRIELPGLEFRAESRRSYRSGIKAPHLFGYLGEISDAELTANGESYTPGDLIGKKGLERQYEKKLRGVKGKRFMEVDALGRVVGDLASGPNSAYYGNSPEPGLDLILGIDAALQRMLEAEMLEHKGGAVVLNCKNGEVLAMVSKPDYDPDLFSRPLSPQDWNRLINDPQKPLYDRMLQSLFAPGSTYKIITVIAGLETGLVDPEERVFCPGYFRMGNRPFGCWKKGGHGTMNMLQAIEQSCDVYFYRMGLKIGLENWAKYSRLFGFGKTTGIDLVDERGGMVPDEEYLNQRYGRNKWSKGLMLNLAIGQGELLVTPLQMAYFAMTIANEGRTFKPRVRRGYMNPITFKEEYPEPDSVFIPGIHSRSYEIAKRGMHMVVNSPTGTAKSAQVPGVISAGKTGTAQNPHGETHAWYIGFAPFENPQIAYCIFLENGGGGGANAAPFARKIIALLHEQNKLVAHALKNEADD
ncbi:MAG: penicillin-binding protein 2 [candidate division KSB1 bacterium]